MDSIDQATQLLAELLAAREAGEAVALATVIKARGSVPRQAGSKMLIYADGRASGTIGGGEMEARVVEAAQAALADGQPVIVPYSLVDPRRGDPGVCGGEVEIYIEPYRPAATVLVIGCGHVGRAVIHLAGWLGFRVIAYDDRPDLATAEQSPGADVYLSGPFEELPAKIKLNDQTYVVAVTRNVLVDRELLPPIIQSPVPYIGVIGSRRRWQETRRLLLADGLDDALFDRCYSPIGLELGAQTPAEIAVSIMAEIIMFRRGGTGELMASSPTATSAGK